MLDFVFSDVESGEGTYDNQGGKDYHLPVEGSKASTITQAQRCCQPDCLAHKFAEL